MEFNSCAHLEVKDHHGDDIKNGLDTLGECLRIQKDSQENVYGFDYDNMSLYDIGKFWMENNTAMISETAELMDALGGSEYGSAAWKHWKSKNKDLKDIKLKDLSPDDLRELHFEIIDIFHFFMNYAISAGLDSKLFYNLFMAKNKENRDRQLRNY